MEEGRENIVSDEFWRVVRMDTNGVRYEEAGRLTRQKALDMVRRREEQIGSHHQTVWAEPMEQEIK